MDAEYKQMMTWVAIALVSAVVGGMIIVYFVVRAYGP
jgi:hypothetical protein